MFTTRSDNVRPISTAMRDIGSARIRSMMPFCRSPARPTVVKAALKATVWVKMPASRNSRYWLPPRDAPKM
ncbi:Uncharacterised protein [Mycobacteroides abscessus subsp. abscessus]|nr:Uncharacterised protein [Mycobacteroides abscessus subsp. abscessus]